MKIEELEPGMLTTEGLVVNVEEDGCSGNYELRYFCIHDSYHGQVIRFISNHDDRDFEILHEIGSAEYRNRVLRYIEERSNCKKDAESDMDLLKAYRRLKC